MDSREEESPLIVDNSSVQTTKQNHARDVHILSCAFLLIFLAYGAAQNLESTINTVSLSVPVFLRCLVEISVIMFGLPRKYGK